MWESLTFLFRLGLYLALSGVVASSLAFVLFSQTKVSVTQAFTRHLNTYFKLSLITYFVSNVGYFWIRVGAFAEEGIQGLLDPLMMSIVYDSGLGDAFVFGFLAAIFAFLFYLSHRYLKRFLVQLIFLTLMLISIHLSFAFTGHTADFSQIEKSLLGIHIMMAFLWLGSLYPLFRFVQLEKNKSVQRLLERYGYYASFLVPLLLIAGGVLVYLISGFEAELLFSYWGGALLIKLVFVGAILVLAAWHKFKLVPNLLTQQGNQKMTVSLVREIYLGLGILALSAVLSTLVSP